MRRFTTRATYFLQEGRENLEETIGIAFRAARLHNISTLVIFTAQGDGVRLAIERFLSQPEYKHIKLVAVTFPQGKKFTDVENNPIVVEISEEVRTLLQQHKVSVVQAHLPFDPIASAYSQRGVLAQDLSLLSDALGMFGGSMSLCVQAVVMACDARAVGLGEHVIALTSDTAILAQATCTQRMLEELTIREILCKPAVLSIKRKELAERIVQELPAEAQPKQLAPRNPTRKRKATSTGDPQPKR